MNSKNGHRRISASSLIPAAGTLVFLLIGLTAGSPFRRSALLLSAVFCGTAAGLLIGSAVRTLKNEFYSIRSVILPGLSLFTACMTALLAGLAFRLPGDGAALPLCRQMLRTAVLCTLPLVCVFSVLLIISNVISDLWLIRNGRGDAANVQGFASAAVLCAGFTAVFYSDMLFPERAAGAVSLEILLFFFAECMLFSALVIMRAAEAHRPEYDRDFIIILGCGLYPDGRPSTMLQNRMKAALRFYEDQRRQEGKQVIFIVSGGQGPDEVCSEAEAMRIWLEGQGVQEARILKEDRSRSTEENMAFSKEIIDSILPNARTAFCTTNFHAFRAGIKARRIGLDADGITYQTEWYFWYNAAVREVVGLLAEALLKK